MTGETNFCKRCERIQSVDEFPGGQNVCNDCYGPKTVQGVLDIRQDLSKKTAELTAKQVMSTLTRTQIDVPHTSELAAEILKNFGGLEQFAGTYFMVVSKILDKDPATRLALDAVKGVTNLLRDSTIFRDSAPDVNSVSDEELEKELTALITRKLEDGSIALPMVDDG